TIFLIGTLVLGCALGIPLAIGRTLRRTRRGENLLSWLRARHTTLKGTGNAAGNAGLAVALFGTAVLATVGLADLKAWFPRQSATGSDGGCGSGCGISSDGGGGDGGGGCGGGCGGCGGGD